MIKCSIIIIVPTTTTPSSTGAHAWCVWHTLPSHSFSCHPPPYPRAAISISVVITFIVTIVIEFLARLLVRAFAVAAEGIANVGPITPAAWSISGVMKVMFLVNRPHWISMPHLHQPLFWKPIYYQQFSTFWKFYKIPNLFLCMASDHFSLSGPASAFWNVKVCKIVRTIPVSIMERLRGGSAGTGSEVKSVSHISSSTKCLLFSILTTCMHAVWVVQTTSRLWNSYTVDISFGLLSIPQEIALPWLWVYLSSLGIRERAIYIYNGGFEYWSSQP